MFSAISSGIQRSSPGAAGAPTGGNASARQGGESALLSNPPPPVSGPPVNGGGGLGNGAGPKREFGLLGREELPQNPDLHAGFGGRKPDGHAVEMLLELAIESAGFHILPLWPDADGEQVFASTDIERAIGNRGGGHHGLAELVFGEHLVLAAGGQDEAVAVLVNDVDLVAGGHGRAAEGARPAAETLLVQIGRAHV